MDGAERTDLERERRVERAVQRPKGSVLEGE
jgi:hypothetical protein